MNGLDLALLIKSDAALAGAKLIMLTSMQSKPPRETLEAAQILECLLKPVKKKQLKEAIVAAFSPQGPGKPPSGDTTSFASNPARSHPETAAPTRNTVQHAGTKPWRMLIAEDNRVNQKLAERLVARLGYEADLVSNGAEALLALERQRYDLILMDCHMPSVDGYDATRRIRARERQNTRDAQRPVFIIAVTANAMPEDRDKCLAAGMDAYVSKPIELDELERALERFETKAAENTGVSF
jgi:CheY-like chemotaxis protein